MSDGSANPFHTVKDEWLASYAAGALSPLKRLVIACQVEMQPLLASYLRRLDEVGGAFLETAKGEAISSSFVERLLASIDDAPQGTDKISPDETRVSGSRVASWAPAQFQEFLEHSKLRLRWRKAGPGVERAQLVEDGNERLYLLKAKPGLKLPMHTHQGEEWTLILQGGYHVGDKGYARGDLHREDETCTHQPMIDDGGEACISLVVDEGMLKFTDPIMKILQPLIRI